MRGTIFAEGCGASGLKIKPPRINREGSPPARESPAGAKQGFYWAPNMPLRVGMEKTYRWVYDQAKAREEGRPYIAAAA